MEPDKIATELARMSRADAVDPKKDYFVFELTGTLDGRVQIGVQTQWAGFENDDFSREIRKASVMNPAWWLETWGMLKEPFLVVNNPVEVALFLREGGNALVEVETAKWMFPATIAPQLWSKLPDLKITPKSKDAFNRAPTPKVRNSVLKRDQYRCVMCGQRPADDVNVQLHVHHIIPWEDGGLSEKKNLISLCHTCHTGLHPHFDPELFKLIPNEEPLDERELKRDYKVTKVLYSRAWGKTFETEETRADSTKRYPITGRRVR